MQKSRNEIDATNDGSVTVNMPGGKSVDIDLLELRLAIQERQPAGDQLTREDLRVIAEELQGLGVVGCTPTMAWKIWQQADEMVATLKKSTSETPK